MREDILAGRYGNFTFVVASEDEATRGIISDVATAQGVPVFVTTSPTNSKNVEPVGDLTIKDRETLSIVLQAGGTVTAAQLTDQLQIEQATAGNRLIA